jgi:N-acetylmuramoyl-L-alanine amidase
MRGRDIGSARIVRQALAWLGLALVIGSFVWWQMLPESQYNAAARAPEPSRTEGVNEVIIDAGHGGQDSGTIHAGLLEKDLTLDVSRRLDRILKTKGIATVLTRSGDNYVSLAGRAAAANREQNALFVSIHFDDAQPAATGVQTYYAARRATTAALVASWLPFLQTNIGEQENFESQSLAGFVQDSLVARTHAVNRGTRPEQFYVIANVRHPAVLVEGGFITNKDDAMKLTTEEYREQLAAAIADGVLKYRDVVRERQRTLAVQLPGT